MSEPVVEPVVDAPVDPVVEPVVDAPVDPVVEPVVDAPVDPVVDVPTSEPVVETVIDEPVEPVADAPVADASGEVIPMPMMMPEVPMMVDEITVLTPLLADVSFSGALQIGIEFVGQADFYQNLLHLPLDHVHWLVPNPDTMRYLQDFSEFSVCKLYYAQLGTQDDPEHDVFTLDTWVSQHVMDLTQLNVWVANGHLWSDLVAASADTWKNVQVVFFTLRFDVSGNVINADITALTAAMTTHGFELKHLDGLVALYLRTPSVPAP